MPKDRLLKLSIVVCREIFTDLTVFFADTDALKNMAAVCSYTIFIATKNVVDCEMERAVAKFVNLPIFNSS